MFEGEQLSGEKQLEHLGRAKMLLRKVRSIPEKLWPLFEHVIERNWGRSAQTTGILVLGHNFSLMMYKRLIDYIIECLIKVNVL